MPKLYQFSFIHNRIDYM